MLHEYQPEKLAAAEGLFETQDFAPLAIGGFTDKETQEIKYAIEIPWALSFLAGNSFETVVVGLNDFPEEYWPPLFVHTLFNGMVLIGSFLIFLSMAGFAWSKLLKKQTFPKPFMYAFVIAGPLSLLSIEFGWIFACTGRQPWVIYRILATADVVTGSTQIGLLFILFSSIYVILGVAVLLVLKYYFKRHPVENELDDTLPNNNMSIY
jgi:cytochrome d ubiquinol oxidase subunit I